MQLNNQIFWGKTLCSFLLVLMLMPLGHALMIVMEHLLSETTLHYCAFLMGLMGLIIVIIGVFSSNHTKGTILGLLGGLLFWTGWVEFLFSYYAWRYGVHCDLIGNGLVQTISEYANGIPVSHEFYINGETIDNFDRTQLKLLRGSRPEYLILPATFGMWMMIVMLYTFCTNTGCLFLNWIQRFFKLKNQIAIKPLTRIPAMVTFMELNMMMWSCYLLLMFCYDPIFFGSDHWVTFAIALGCLVGSIYLLWRQLHIKSWPANIRMSIATVIIFWTFIEVIARNGILKEIWVDPFNHIPQLSIMFLFFLSFPLAYFFTNSIRKR